MALFPELKTDPVVQINDRIRLDASLSFSNAGDSIAQVEIEAESGVSGYVDVTNAGDPSQWFLDWKYAGSSRQIQANCRLNGTEVFSFDIQLLTASDDYLFSEDKDILTIESELLNFLPQGRSSYIYQHRKARDLILDDFNIQGVTDADGNALTKEDFADLNEVREWAAFKTLSIIYFDLSNSVDDVFDRKSNMYKNRAFKSKDRAFIRVDRNNDGTIDQNTEGVNMQTRRLYRF